MYRVCAHYCGTTVELETLHSKEEAVRFISIPVIMDENDTYYPDEMWIEQCEEENRK
jgi:hypothetical protein